VEKYNRPEQATDDNMEQAHCTLDTYGYKYTLRVCNIYYFPLQQWLNEHVSMLRYTYIAYLVKSHVVTSLSHIVVVCVHYYKLTAVTRQNYRPTYNYRLLTLLFLF